MSLLTDVRVLEFGAIGPVPYAGMLLADLGADVVRIERPDRPPRRNDVALRGRKVIALDLKQSADLDLAQLLARRADVVIEGLRPGAMERLGLGPDEVCAANRRLIYARMTGWGQTGPWASMAGHDINYIAITGALAAIGPRGGTPTPPLNLLGDYAGGSLFLVVGILAALIEQRSSGQGQVIDAAICDGVVSLSSLFHTLLANGQWREERGENHLDGASPSYTTYRCADGEYIAVGAGEPQFYEQFCELAGLTDPCFAERADRTRWADLKEKTQAVFATRTRDEWMAIFRKTDACVAPILSFSEAPHHEHLRERGTFQDVNGILQAAPVPRFSRSHTPIRDTQSLTRAEACSYWAQQ